MLDRALDSLHIGPTSNYPVGEITVNHDTSCMPAKLLSKLRYFESHAAWDPGATGTYEYVYRGNNVYDPYQTGVGSKALGHDMMAVAYGSYKVLASHLRWSGRSGDASKNVDVYVVAHYLSANLGTPAYFQSLPGCAVIHLSADDRDKSIVCHARTADVLGKKDSGDLDDDTSGAYGSSPTTEWYWHILIHNSTATDVDVQGRLTIDYDTLSYHPIAVS
jgi:hypothetical protein